MHYLSLILMVIITSAVNGCMDNKTALPGDQKDFTPEVLTQNKLMQRFAANHPGLAVLKYARADLDDDGKEDLIVIYRLSPEQNQMCVMHYRGPEVIETNSVPAPVSDQMIQFRNIDEKPPLEFILQGRKGAKVGYAIFRIEKNLLTDLFGEGMEDCC